MRLVGVSSERNIKGLSTSRVRRLGVWAADMGLDAGLWSKGIGRAAMGVARAVGLGSRSRWKVDLSTQISKTAD